MLGLPKYDPEGWLRSGSLTILAVCGLHIHQAILLLYSPYTASTTALISMRSLLKGFGVPAPEMSIGIMMLVSAFVAAMGVLYRIGRSRFFWLLSQQVFLGVMAAGGIIATIKGYYLDGTKIHWQQINADQAAYLWFFIAHFVAIGRRCWDE